MIDFTHKVPETIPQSPFPRRSTNPMVDIKNCLEEYPYIEEESLSSKNDKQSKGSSYSLPPKSVKSKNGSSEEKARNHQEQNIVNFVNNITVNFSGAIVSENNANPSEKKRPKSPQ